MKKTKALIFLLSILFSLCTAYLIFPEYFMLNQGIKKSVDIEIIATAEKNIISYGTDVRINQILVDGQNIDFSEVKYDNAWEITGNGIECINPSDEAKLNFQIEASEIIFDFVKHDGSGNVQITINGNEAWSESLYSKDWENVTWKYDISEKFSIAENLSLFLFLILLYFGVITIIYPEVEAGFEKKNTVLTDKSFLKKNSIAAGRIIFLNIVFYAISDFQFDSAITGMEIGIFLALSYVIAQIWISQCRRKNIWKEYWIFYWLITPWVVFWICEVVGKNSIFNMDFSILLANYLIYGILFNAILMIIPRRKTAVGMFLILAVGYSIINYYVTVFRGTPIAPMDIFAWRTALNVADNYVQSFSISPEVLLEVECAFLWISLSEADGIRSDKWKRRVICGSAAGSMTCLLLLGNFLDISFDFWNLQYNVKTYGLALNITSQIKQSRVSKPDDYDILSLQDIASRYSETDSEEEYVKPNVIAIMNESFSDLQGIRAFATSENCLSYYNQLKENTVKGKVYVSIFGGLTCNTEYEFLTGNSLAFLPQGSIPFQQYVNKENVSLAEALKKRGYETIAIHPYLKSGWNRERVYKNLGIDSFYGLEAFSEDSELVRNSYISDTESYKMVIQKFEEIKKSGKPAFIFNVTMQNHGGYLMGGLEQKITITDSSGTYPDAEEYLTVVKKSDEAIKVLIDYFQKVDEPTVIVFFGDHQPGLSNEFYDFIYGKTIEERTMEEEMLRYQVPFFIWANYDIEEKENLVLSANYLPAVVLETSKAELFPYMRFLNDVRKEVPVMNNKGFMDASFVWHSWGEKSSPLLETYWKIQYNNVFDDAKLEMFYN